MRSSTSPACVSGFTIAASISTAGFGQPNVVGGPLTGPPVPAAPFSAEATTTVQQTLADGTRIDASATARYYRDREGRVRVEQFIGSSGPPRVAPGNDVRITIDPEPVPATPTR